MIDTKCSKYPYEKGTFELTKEFINQKGQDGQTKEPRLIICLGNLTVKSGVAYEGSLFASKVITLESGCQITSKAEETAKVFQCRYWEGTTETPAAENYCPMDFFWEGEEYILNGVAAGSLDSLDGNSLNLSDLVLYENWSKE